MSAFEITTGPWALKLELTAVDADADCNPDSDPHSQGRFDLSRHAKQAGATPCQEPSITAITP